MATFVLVHGGFHGGWCWKKVTPFLRAAGHEVHTPTLTRLGERAPARSRHHAGDARAGCAGRPDVRGVDRCLPGRAQHGGRGDHHRRGHGPGAPGAPRLPRRHRAARRGGRPLAPHCRAAGGLGAAAPRARDGVAPPPLAQPFGVTDPDDARWVNAHLTPQPLRCFTEPVRLHHQDALAGRRTSIACAWAGVGGQGASPIGARVRGEPGWRFRELDTGHDAMVTAPRELAELLLEVAALG